MEHQALPLLMETVNPQFVRDVVSRIDPRLLAALEGLSVRDRVIGLYCEAELAELSPAEVANVYLIPGGLRKAPAYRGRRVRLWRPGVVRLQNPTFQKIRNHNASRARAVPGHPKAA